MSEFVYGALCGIGGFVVLGFIIALVEWLTEQGYHLFGAIVEKAKQRKRTRTFEEVVGFPVFLEVMLAVGGMIIIFILAFAMFIGLMEILDW